MTAIVDNDLQVAKQNDCSPKYRAHTMNARRTTQMLFTHQLITSPNKYGGIGLKIQLFLLR